MSVRPAGSRASTVHRHRQVRSGHAGGPVSEVPLGGQVAGSAGVGGTVGLLVTGVFATATANPNPNTNLAALVGRSLWREQLTGIGVTLLLTTLGTALIALAVPRLMGRRPPNEAQVEGPDLGERAARATTPAPRT